MIPPLFLNSGPDANGLTKLSQSKLVKLDKTIDDSNNQHENTDFAYELSRKDRIHNNQMAWNRKRENVISTGKTDEYSENTVKINRDTGDQNKQKLIVNNFKSSDNNSGEKSHSHNASNKNNEDTKGLVNKIKSFFKFKA